MRRNLLNNFAQGTFDRFSHCIPRYLVWSGGRRVTGCTGWPTGKQMKVEVCIVVQVVCWTTWTYDVLCKYSYLVYASDLLRFSVKSNPSCLPSPYVWRVLSLCHCSFDWEIGLWDCAVSVIAFSSLSLSIIDGLYPIIYSHVDLRAINHGSVCSSLVIYFSKNVTFVKST